jgi:hypothetical protein
MMRRRRRRTHREKKQKKGTEKHQSLRGVGVYMKKTKTITKRRKEEEAEEQ